MDELRCPVCHTWFMKKQWEWVHCKNIDKHILSYALVCRNVNCQFQFCPKNQEKRITNLYKKYRNRKHHEKEVQ